MNVDYSQAQLQTGRYLPIKSKSFFGFLRPKIPSYLFLDINSDSTYYKESFWGSFLEKQVGTWKTFNDTVVFFAKCQDEFNETVVLTKNFRYLDSLKNKIVISIFDLTFRPVKGFVIELYKDNSVRKFITGNNGMATFDYCRVDSITLKGNKYSQFKTLSFKPDLQIQNFYEIELCQTYYIFKKDYLYNDFGKAIYKR